ncbi:Golgin subfamily A member 7/ERF4 family-domain-containing protein [Sordaria sp. MPI-SDFR-AT-0083]|nr:Golgin subfamily A member 7/ERF4 family-domain-containing protein [Sordaria sp. MPI-SDFR-AT-0083]
MLGNIPAHLYSSLEATAVDSTAIETPSTIPLHPYPLTANTQLPSPSLQPNYPGAHTSTPSPPPSAALSPAFAPGFGRSPRRAHDNPPVSLLQSPFRTRGAVATSTSPLNRQYAHFHSPHRQLPARLWNPTNSTPRLPPTPTPTATTRRRRQSSPPPPAIPLTLPSPHLDFDPSYPTAAGAGDQPLLSAPKNQQQTRHSVISARASLQLDRSAQHSPLPRTLRHSLEGKRASLTPSPFEQVEETDAGPSRIHAIQEIPESNTSGRKSRGQSVSSTKSRVPVGLSFDHGKNRLDKGKGKEGMAHMENEQDAGERAGFSPDLERGPDVMDARQSMSSRISGIGSAISSDDSDILGDPDQQPDAGDEWGPQHACYPHLNPHVPLDSPEYINTRIIRVRRDWLLEGDLAPTFSNLYPEILEPAGLSEQEFRRVIQKLNSELVPIFSPYNWRNILDGVLGLATGWLWEDFGFTGVKGRLQNLENWIEQWNKEMEKTVGSEDGTIPPKIVPLKRTGYMTLDIQIPDPEIAPAPPTPGASRGTDGAVHAEPTEPPQHPPAVTVL